MNNILLITTSALCIFELYNEIGDNFPFSSVIHTPFGGATAALGFDGQAGALGDSRLACPDAASRHYRAYFVLYCYCMAKKVIGQGEYDIFDHISIQLIGSPRISIISTTLG